MRVFEWRVWEKGKEWRNIVLSGVICIYIIMVDFIKTRQLFYCYSDKVLKGNVIINRAWYPSNEGSLKSIDSW